MSLPSARRRAALYDQLHVYLDAGTSILEALESLSQSSPGSVASLCVRAREKILDGKTFADAFREAEPKLPRFEYAVLRASELAGRMPVACRILTETLDRLIQLKRDFVTASIYPLVMLHLAIVLTNTVIYLARAVKTEHFNMAGYLQAVITQLLVLHAIIWGTYLIVRVVTKNLGIAAVLEGFLRMIPVAGKTWKSLIVSRFAQAYDGMLNAGTGVIDALDVAAHATNSAIIRMKVDDILPEVQRGQSVAMLIQQNRILGKPWEEFLVTGERSGRQEEMLRRIVNQSTQEAERGFDILRKWLPRIVLFLAAIWIMIALALAYMAYIQGVLDTVDKAMQPGY